MAALAAAHCISIVLCVTVTVCTAAASDLAAVSSAIYARVVMAIGL